MLKGGERDEASPGENQYSNLIAQHNGFKLHLSKAPSSSNRHIGRNQDEEEKEQRGMSEGQWWWWLTL